MYHNFFDSHVHTKNSPDAASSLTELCEAAISRGIMGFAVTDHFECDQTQERYDLVMLHSLFDVRKAHATFGPQLAVSMGIELAQPLFNTAQRDKILRFAEYDFILGSLHCDSRHPDYYFVDFRQEDVYACLERYYQEMLDMVRWGGFDALAHMTYPLRYIEGVCGIPVEMSRFDELIDEILRSLAEQGKALELNTSGLRQPYGKTLPELEYFRRFRRLGGEIVTIGSDAHHVSDIGAGIQEGMALLAAAGFDHFAFYSQRRPRMLQIL